MGLDTGGVKSVPIASLDSNQGRPVEYTQSLLGACPTQKSHSWVDSMGALADEGRTLQFPATGQKGTFLPRKRQMWARILVPRMCLWFYSPPTSCCPMPAPRRMMSPGGPIPTPQSTLPHHASEGQEREPRPCKRSGRHVRKLFTGGYSKEEQGHLPLPAPTPS